MLYKVKVFTVSATQIKAISVFNSGSLGFDSFTRRIHLLGS
jgi:hypothetical protein